LLGKLISQPIPNKFFCAKAVAVKTKRIDVIIIFFIAIVLELH